MSDTVTPLAPAGHDHVFLGAGHERAERRTWSVIVLCTVMMVIEIVGGIAYGSIALTADGLHMFTHAGALLLAAFAYRIARQRAHDARFSFGTGKVGDLAGFTSAIVLAMIAVLIGYESVVRAINPLPIDYNEALIIAAIGLLVNIGSVWMLSHGEHGHQHGHGRNHAHAGYHEHAEEVHRVEMSGCTLQIEIHEDGVPPRFRIEADGRTFPAGEVAVETRRPDGGRQTFTMRDCGGYLESMEEIPEPHAFDALVRYGGHERVLTFQEHEHGAAHHDNNMRAAVIHVLADAAVSVLVIVGLLLARFFGWVWLDPAAGLLGAAVIAAWSYGLIRDTGAILLDVTPDQRMLDGVRRIIEQQGDRLADLHVWRLGPGHLGAIVSVVTSSRNSPEHYRALLRRFSSLSHVTVEVRHAAG